MAKKNKKSSEQKLLIEKELRRIAELAGTKDLLSEQSFSTKAQNWILDYLGEPQQKMALGPAARAVGKAVKAVTPAPVRRAVGTAAERFAETPLGVAFGGPDPGGIGTGHKYSYGPAHRVSGMQEPLDYEMDTTALQDEALLGVAAALSAKLPLGQLGTAPRMTTTARPTTALARNYTPAAPINVQASTVHKGLLPAKTATVTPAPRVAVSPTKALPSGPQPKALPYKLAPHPDMAPLSSIEGGMGLYPPYTPARPVLTPRNMTPSQRSAMQALNRSLDKPLTKQPLALPAKSTHPAAANYLSSNQHWVRGRGPVPARGLQLPRTLAPHPSMAPLTALETPLPPGVQGLVQRGAYTPAAPFTPAAGPGRGFIMPKSGLPAAQSTSTAQGYKMLGGKGPIAVQQPGGAVVVYQPTPTGLVPYQGSISTAGLPTYTVGLNAAGKATLVPAAVQAFTPGRKEALADTGPSGAPPVDPTTGAPPVDPTTGAPPVDPTTGAPLAGGYTEPGAPAVGIDPNQMQTCIDGSVRPYGTCPEMMQTCLDGTQRPVGTCPEEVATGPDAPAAAAAAAPDARIQRRRNNRRRRAIGLRKLRKAGIPSYSAFYKGLKELGLEDKLGRPGKDRIWGPRHESALKAYLAKTGFDRTRTDVVDVGQGPQEVRGGGYATNVTPDDFLAHPIDGSYIKPERRGTVVLPPEYQGMPYLDIMYDPKRVRAMRAQGKKYMGRKMELPRLRRQQGVIGYTRPTRRPYPAGRTAPLPAPRPTLVPVSPTRRPAPMQEGQNFSPEEEKLIQELTRRTIKKHLKK